MRLLSVIKKVLRGVVPLSVSVGLATVLLPTAYACNCNNGLGNGQGWKNGVWKQAWRRMLMDYYSGSGNYPAAQNPNRNGYADYRGYMDTLNSLQSYMDSQSGLLPANMQLRMLLRQHAMGGALAFMARYDQNPDYGQIVPVVDNNSRALSSLIGSLYGQDAGGRFSDVWNTHIDLLNQYTDAVINQDDNSQQQISDRLNSTVRQMTDFFTQENGQVNHDQLGQLIQTHIEDEKAIIRAHAQGNQQQVSQLIATGGMHMDMLADMLTGGQPDGYNYQQSYRYNPPSPARSSGVNRDNDMDND